MPIPTRQKHSTSNAATNTRSQNPRAPSFCTQCTIQRVFAFLKNLTSRISTITYCYRNIIKLVRCNELQYRIGDEDCDKYESNEKPSTKLKAEVSFARSLNARRFASIYSRAGNGKERGKEARRRRCPNQSRADSGPKLFGKRATPSGYESRRRKSTGKVAMSCTRGASREKAAKTQKPQLESWGAVLIEQRENRVMGHGHRCMPWVHTPWCILRCTSTVYVCGIFTFSMPILSILWCALKSWALDPTFGQPNITARRKVCVCLAKHAS